MAERNPIGGLRHCKATAAGLGVEPWKFHHCFIKMVLDLTSDFEEPKI